MAENKYVRDFPAVSVAEDTYEVPVSVGVNPLKKATIGKIRTMKATGSTAQRTLADRFAEKINVADWAPDRTGATDCTAQLTLAFALVTGAGATVRFPKGDYQCLDIVIPENVHIKFDKGARLIAPPGSSGVKYFFRIAGTADTPKNKVWFDKVQADGGGLITGIAHVQYVDGVKFTDCHVENFSMGGNSGAVCGSMLNCTNVRVYRCYGSDGNYGTNLETCDDGVVEGCSFFNMKRDGIIVYLNSNNVTVAHCMVDGFCVGLEDGRAGIDFYGSTNVQSIGNKVKNSAEGTPEDSSGIRFRDVDGFVSSGDICTDVATGILCNENNDFAPIQTRGVISNFFTNRTKFSGINVAGNCNEVVINGGMVKAANLPGTAGKSSVNIASPRCVVIGVTCIDNVAPGIYLAANHCRAESCIIIRCGNGGVSVPGIRLAGADCSCHNNTFIDDRVTPIATLGIRIDATFSAIIGHQTYVSPGIVTNIKVDNGATVKAGSAPIVKRFAGAPSEGTWATGTQVIDSNGVHWVCTSGGTSGTWRKVSNIDTIHPNGTSFLMESLTGVATAILALSVGNNVQVTAPTEGGSVQIGAPGGSIQMITFGVTRAKIDESATAGDTALLVWDVTKGALSRVSVGTADSAGLGYKLMKVPN